MRLSSIDPHQIAIECADDLPREAAQLSEPEVLAKLFQIACRKVAEARNEQMFGFARRATAKSRIANDAMSPTDVGPPQRLPPKTV